MANRSASSRARFVRRTRGLTCRGSSSFRVALAASHPARWARRAGSGAPYATIASCCSTSAAQVAARRITAQTLPWRGDAQAQADYLKLFRADAIVRDAEIIRKTLLGPDEKWSILGQSYGGFCSTTYLSLAPEGLREAYITGGLPPVHLNDPDGVYRATYKRVFGKNRLYFARYPDDADRAAAIISHLAKKKVEAAGWQPAHAAPLPGVGRNLWRERRLRSCPLPAGGSLRFRAAWTGVERDVPAERAALVDTCRSSATRDPARRVLHAGGGVALVRLAHPRRVPEFEPSPEHAPLFIGEMMYPWMFEEDRGLAPMREAAEILAQYEDWPALYDIEQLRANTVPVAAAVYFDDMYVERGRSRRRRRRRFRAAACG